jgi:hypothetical protein
MATERMSIEEQRAWWCVCDDIESGHCNYCAEQADAREFAKFKERCEIARLQKALFASA